MRRLPQFGETAASCTAKKSEVRAQARKLRRSRTIARVMRKKPIAERLQNISHAPSRMRPDPIRMANPPAFATRYR